MSGETAGVLCCAVMHDVTTILAAIDRGELHAAERLLPLVYDELRRLAAAQMAREKPGQTLDATALVHEAYVRLVGPADERRWENRRHFFAAAGAGGLTWMTWRLLPPSAATTCWRWTRP